MNQQRISFKIIPGDNYLQEFHMMIHYPVEMGKHMSENYINKFNVSVDGGQLIEYSLANNLSRNPYFSFVMKIKIVSGQLIKFKFMGKDKVASIMEVVAMFDDKGVYRYSNYK